MSYFWPLMHNNITRQDMQTVIKFLQKMPILTQAENVRSFEDEWSDWLGVKHSVFVNSGSSANFITMGILRHMYGTGEIIVPALTWVSDIASVLQHGFKPVFVDISPHTLGMDDEQVLRRITKKTKGVFLTHILGFNALSTRLIRELRRLKIPLIEDACESHGATFKKRKIGTFGLISNFSFYFAHHMSTIEGGMVCTSDPDIYQMARVLRSHGMVRESTSEQFRSRFEKAHPDLNPKFIFAYPSCNYRSTEINAVIGRSQLKTLDANNVKRAHNFDVFLKHLDPVKYRTDFATEGSVNYAFILILNEPNKRRRDAVMRVMDQHGIEYRRGTSGGGNQLRQPYLRGIIPNKAWTHYPEVDHVHFFGFYIGNYPSLNPNKIQHLCALLNSVD